MSDSPAWKKSGFPATGNVVGSFASSAFMETDWEALPAWCDAVEFRLDAFPSSVPELREALAKNPLPSLLTVRDPREGGLNNLGRTPRQALMLNLVEEIDLIDVEIGNLQLFPDVVEQAHDEGVKIVGSFHDFQSMPSRERLEQLIEEARAGGADVVKLAVVLSTVDELATLAGLLTRFPEIPLSLMGMGKLGPVSRLVLGQAGSVMNYGYLDEPTVPGQWQAGELKRLLAHLRAAEPPSPDEPTSGEDIPVTL